MEIEDCEIRDFDGCGEVGMVKVRVWEIEDQLVK